MKKTILVFQAFSFVVISLLSINSWSQSDEPAAVSSLEQSRFPVRAIDRSSVLPTGIFAVDLNAKLKSFETVSLDAATQFGVVDGWQGSISYDGAQFNEFQMGRTVTLGAKFNYLVVAPVSLSAELNLPLHIADGEIVREMTLGFPTVFFNQYVAGGIGHDLFTLHMRPNVSSTFKFPVWFGGQIYGNLWADVSTTLAELKLNNKTNQAEWENTYFWKKLPTTLKLLYAFNPYFDLNATFGFEDTLKAEGVSFGLGFSVRGGRLFG